MSIRCQLQQMELISVFWIMETGMKETGSITDDIKLDSLSMQIK